MKGVVVQTPDGEFRAEPSGFTSRANLHRHFLGHVARLFERFEGDSDPERWEELWPDESLPRGAGARRRQAKNLLRSATPQCPIVSSGWKESSCKSCSESAESDQIEAAHRAIGNLAGTYADIVSRSVLDAIGWELQHGPAYMFEKSDGRMPVLSTLSPDMVFAASSVGRGQLRAITAFRFRAPARGTRPPIRKAIADFFQKRHAAYMTGRLLDWKARLDEPEGKEP